MRVTWAARVCCESGRATRRVVGAKATPSADTHASCSSAAVARGSHVIPDQRVAEHAKESRNECAAGLHVVLSCPRPSSTASTLYHYFPTLAFERTSFADRRKQAIGSCSYEVDLASPLTACINPPREQGPGHRQPDIKLSKPTQPSIPRRM